ncbi:MAG: AmmeMemoRadiSam system protein A [Thermodesulfovibrionales bacterium]
MAKRHPYVELARKAIEHYLSVGKMLPAPDDIPEDMKVKAGVFVSLKKFGILRGCIGTFQPSTDNIYTEIVQNAVSAAVRDPRFPPVSLDELNDIDLSVDVLSPPQLVRDINELDPKKYGIIVSKGLRRGLLLPDLKGVDTVQEQINITKSKAGIRPDEEDVDIYKFTVQRFT